ncbi:uncharacterized protein BBA_10335 [Beauveria bassiana ARSEF 2860]|uniref:Protein kinase domain-containing protein n=1 Tax=Beauveria bassiana (strain ARSEF 2860) TaxID=655819 RepID=J4UEM7_BEAB2|nr:uncharacterized protein BBA_10335 [Beauveria bassiana ARSEF 2860]EJP60717.1 hypothetical protein BBA_10335 [Beauveria bassiana ARSEF 2860]
MSVQYNRIRNSEIKLQDVKAQNIPFADDAMVMNRNTPTGDPPAPKRLKKKLCPPTPTDDRLPTKKNDDLITTAQVAVKVPQDTYRRLFDLQLGESNYFTVAEEDRSHPERQSVVIIKTFTGPAAKSQIQAIRRIQHNRFVDAKEFLPIDEGYLVSFEFMPLALCEIAGNPLLNDVRLASVVGQIVDGLLYLEQNGLEHSSLTCSNVLVDLFGNVKIWNQEHIKLSAGRYQHVEALGEIIMYLAHGQARDDGIVGLDEPQRFPLAFDFLSATQTACKLSTVTECEYVLWCLQIEPSSGDPAYDHVNHRQYESQSP